MLNGTVYADRQSALAQRMADAGIDLIFLPPGADLEYLTGIERRLPAFGTIGYAHDWVAGAFFAPGSAPVSTLPRMMTEFDLPHGVPGEVVEVRELDDGQGVMRSVLQRFTAARSIAFGERTWARTVLEITQLGQLAQTSSAQAIMNSLRRIKSPAELELLRQACGVVDGVMSEVQSKVVAGITELDLASEVTYRMRLAGSRVESFDTGVWSMGPHDDRDATVRVSTAPLRPGMGVSFDFGAVIDGYCSDFGRTIHIGEPSAEYIRVYDLVMAAQQAGIDAVRPGVTAAEVHAATRRVIVDGGYGQWFRHRTGHCIGLDVHEMPYISEEDTTPLEEGMTFTIEPSVFWPGHVGVRVEDIIACGPESGYKLNEHPTTMVIND